MVSGVASFAEAGSPKLESSLRAGIKGAHFLQGSSALWEARAQAHELRRRARPALDVSIRDGGEASCVLCEKEKKQRPTGALKNNSRSSRSLREEGEDVPARPFVVRVACAAIDVFEVLVRGQSGEDQKGVVRQEPQQEKEQPEREPANSQVGTCVEF